ncbi:MAG TPA: class I SAM-dependent methyltransferase [Polyangiaceae bacterium]|nr:class I SAM-dependent methyltransferase [Polyangiaceae bacterium]
MRPEDVPLIYLPPSLSGFVNRRAVFSTWTDHLPFAYDLVHAIRPAVVVELGTQAGLSYFAFCQAVVEHAVEARCYAVDTWAGDEHTGAYDDSTWREVSAHNEAHYASFSELLRMRFEEAVHRFPDESIALLHIDGFHMYEAVRADFEAWYPKVVPGGIVLFHDVAARLLDFGAWRYWAELEADHETFLFHHGFGLGVLRKPGGSAASSTLLRLLFESDGPTQSRLRAFYVHAAGHLDLLRQQDAVEKLKASVREKRRAAGG